MADGRPLLTTVPLGAHPAESARDAGTPGTTVAGWLAGGRRRARGPCPGDAGSGWSVQWTVSLPTSYPKAKTSSHELPRQVGQKRAGRGSPSPAPSSLRAEGGAGQPHAFPRPQFCSSKAYSPRRFSSPYRVPESRRHWPLCPTSSSAQSHLSCPHRDSQPSQPNTKKAQRSGTTWLG